ncbi:hypothetical protein OAN61_00545 [bacterium]|nr:hypothetical protein [bacterium]
MSFINNTNRTVDGINSLYGIDELQLNGETGSAGQILHKNPITNELSLEPGALLHRQHHSVPAAETPAAAVAAAIAATTLASAVNADESPKSASIRKLRAEVEAQRAILSNHAVAAVRLEAAHIAGTAARS